MEERTWEGECLLCNGTYGKRQMTKHLRECIKSKVISEASPKTRLVHIVVEGRYAPEYWLHLEAKANAELESLDSFLRDIWLECCGHMSAFRIEGEEYASGGPWPELGDKGMGVRLGDVLKVGMKFEHEYDFGTTTHVALEVVSERQGEMKGKPIRLLARNEPPSILCELCGKPATQVCAQCIYEGKGWLCDECAQEHECGEEMFLPVVNSPRVGMCGYTGQAW